MIHHEYSVGDGRFTGRKVSGPEGFTPTPRPGMAYMSGVSDPKRSRVITVVDDFGVCTRSLESTVPPKPLAINGWDWEWDETYEEWVGVLTPEGRARVVRRRRDVYLQETDYELFKRLEEILLASPNPDPNVVALIQYRRNLRDLPTRADFKSMTPDDVPPPAQGIAVE